MDTKHASPQFKVGDKVKIKADEHDVTRKPHPIYTVAAVSGDSFRLAGDHRWWPMCKFNLAAVEPWRLLFRAHRDGWRLVHSTNDGGFRHRMWHNAISGSVINTTTRKAAVR